MFIVYETQDKNNSEIVIINSPIGKILIEQINASECISQLSSSKISQTKAKRTLFSCESSKRLKSGKIQLFLNMY